jgi:bacillithiol biosynthesis deacetylase BshB1
MVSNVDVMAFGAHPDDIEIGCGGTLLKLSIRGYRVVLVDLVRGEMATRGTVAERNEEAAKAARIIGVEARQNLELKDGHIAVTDEAKRKVAEVVRSYRPSLAMVPYCRDRHPDHYRTSEVVYEGLFMAGLERFETGQESFRPPRIIYFMQWEEFTPTFIVDITEQYEKKMEAIYTYRSQFKPNDNFYKLTKLTSREYNWSLTSRMAYYGSLIGKKYGEGFLVKGHIEVEDPLSLIFSSF